MSSIPTNFLEQCEKVLGKSAQNPMLLGDNKYCSILQVTVDGEPIIIKKYKTGDAKLATLEAEGVNLYHQLAGSHEGLIDSKTLFLDKELNMVGFSFIHGDRLSDFLHRVAHSKAEWKTAANHMRILGLLLSSLRQETIADGTFYDSFHEEYFLHCSRSLRQLPLLGTLFFSSMEKDAMGFLKALDSKKEPPSRAHGDYVFRNIHVDGDKVGVIDFANTIPHSHPYNDIMNLWFALRNMWIPNDFRRLLWDALVEGYGPQDHPLEVKKFFFEYHRRRWLMLNFKTANPRRLLRAFRGLATFARPGQLPEMEPE